MVVYVGSAGTVMFDWTELRFTLLLRRKLFRSCGLMQSSHSKFLLQPFQISGKWQHANNSARNPDCTNRQRSNAEAASTCLFAVVPGARLEQIKGH